MMTRLKGVLVYALLAVVCAVWAWPVTAGSPVEGTILFQSDRTGAWRMYRLLPDGTDTELLPGANWTTTQRPRVTRDGKFVVFEGNQDKSTTDVYMMAIDGSGLRRVTDTALNVFFPVLSPDGTKIAFEMDTQLWVVNVDGTGMTQLTTEKGRQASWSPDGTQLVFSSNRTGTDQLFIINADGTGERQLTTYSGHSRFPDWSPDGKKIVFDSNMGGNYDIYVLDLETKAIKRLTSNSGNDMSPRWSPDGTKILFTSVRDGAKESLYVMDADGSNQTLVRTLPGYKNEYGSWGL